MKRKLYYWTRCNVNSLNIKTVLLLIPLMIIFFKTLISNEYDFFNNMLDVSILITFIVIGISETLAKLIQNVIMNKTEDIAKLDEDYDRLNNKYSSMDLIESNDIKYPEISIAIMSKDTTLRIEDNPNKYYKLPKQIKEVSQLLMKAHKYSTIYNQINIRLDDIKIEDNEIILSTSRTHYFDSLITNRVCDYQFGNCGRTLREIYEPGPFMKQLSLSKMSNHLGFNGFAITSDQRIPFIYRNNNLSIAKGMWSTSVSASLKAQYALLSKNDYQLTLDSLGYAIAKEFNNELGIEDGALTAENAMKSIYCFYRDLVECGKPQFSVYLKLENTSSSDIEKSIQKKIKSQGNEKDKVIKDGKKAVFFSLDDLKSAKFQINHMEIKGEKYTMMPSSIVSVILLIRYLDNCKK